MFFSAIVVFHFFLGVAKVERDVLGTDRYDAENALCPHALEVRSDPFSGENVISGYLDGTIQKVLPGEWGVPIERRPTPQQVRDLTEKYGVEFAVTYVLGTGKNGGGGRYWLHSGTAENVAFPQEANRMFIYHSHFTGVPEASPNDRASIEVNRRIGNPQRSSQVVAAGKESPTHLKRIPRMSVDEIGIVSRWDARTPSQRLFSLLEKGGIPIATNAERKALENERFTPPFVDITHGTHWEKTKLFRLNENTLSDLRQFDRRLRQLCFTLPETTRFFITKDGHLILANLGQNIQVPIHWSQGDYVEGAYSYGSRILQLLASDATEAIQKRKEATQTTLPDPVDRETLLLNYRMGGPWADQPRIVEKSKDPRSDIAEEPIHGIRKGPHLLWRSLFKETYDVEGRPDLALVVQTGFDPTQKGRWPQARNYWTEERILRLIQNEHQGLKRLEEAGIPTVKVHAIGTFDGFPAMVLDRFAVSTNDRKFSEVKSKLVTQESLNDLLQIEAKLERSPYAVRDLHFYISAEGGKLVLAEPAGVYTESELAPGTYLQYRKVQKSIIEDIRKELEAAFLEKSKK